MSQTTERILVAESVSRKFLVRQGLFAKKKTLTAVDAASFFLKKGECLGLVGESGCGKSTLGRLSCGLLQPTQGSILFCGTPLPPAGAGSWARGRIQMIFQDPFSSLNPRMTVQDAVAEPLTARGIPRAERIQAAEDMLARVGLKGTGKRYPHEFSGGQRQRIAIARSVMTHPDIIICDEAVSALDASVQAQILNLLKDMQEEFSPAYLFISHDLNIVGFMCQRILVMYLGRLLEEGPTEELFRHPAHPYTEALLAARNGLDASHPPLTGEIPSPLDPPAGCAFHPRCPYRKPLCEETMPPWTELSPGWRVRCHVAQQRVSCSQRSG
ncbi:MAG: ATP-binding cassette domain-containing protein [Desulfovibrionaceae bacterium]|nr:ATP-binding cassette domain-containing protein [Desulfovibrionaceae bacterium]